jgi:hypothetical protein
MKKVIILSFFIMLTGSAIILTGCKKELHDLSSYSSIGNTKNDSLRIYNLLNTTTGIGYLVYINDSLNMFRGVAFNSTGVIYGAAPTVSVPAEGGTFTIKLAQYPYATGTIPSPPIKNPDASAIVCQKTITLPPHSGYGNIVFYDSLGTIPTMRYLPLASGNAGAPAPGKFKIRLVNFSYAMAPLGYNSTISPKQSAGPQYNLQLQYRDSTVMKGNENVPFAGVSNYQEIDYGTEQFLVYNLTTKAYIKNSGPFNDVLAMFNLSPILPFPSVINNCLYPMISDYTVKQYNTSTLQLGNIGSYPFAPGSCYTVMVIGNMYSVSLDRRYGPGVLDNVGKVQIVNANPNQQDMEVKITYAGGQKDIPNLPFGKVADPVTVPAGPVSVTFLSQGKTVYSYNVQVPRLGDYTYYYTADNNTLPFVFSQANTIIPQDYIPGSPNSIALYQLIKIGGLDLSPDAGALFFTVQTNIAQGVDARFNAISTDVTYKNTASNIGTGVGTNAYTNMFANNYAVYDGTLPPTAFNVRLTSSRPDSLAGKKLATISPAFAALPAPGNYTLVAAGLLNTIDPAKKVRLILVKHTNFTSKAQ